MTPDRANPHRVNKARAVLFDLDGTLIDSSQGFATAINALLAEMNLPEVSLERIREEVSMGARALLKQYLPQYQEQDYQALRQRFLAHFVPVVGEQFEPYPGVSQCMHWLHQAKIPWGIVTNKPFCLTEPTLARLDWQGRQALVCPDHVLQAKPSGEGLLLACQQLGLEPHQVAYLGDHQIDVLAAREAGCQAWATAWGLRPASEQPEHWQADAICPTSDQLQSFLAERIA